MIKSNRDIVSEIIDRKKVRNRIQMENKEKEIEESRMIEKLPVFRETSDDNYYYLRSGPQVNDDGSLCFYFEVGSQRARLSAAKVKKLITYLSGFLEEKEDEQDNNGNTSKV